jgi:hypothetical protein
MLASDLRLAARTLRNAPVFTLTAGITLALGIGLMLAISVREAIRDAIAAFGAPGPIDLPSPATPERVFFAIRAMRSAQGHELTAVETVSGAAPS